MSSRDQAFWMMTLVAVMELFAIAYLLLTKP